MGGGFDERKVERGLRVQFDASFLFFSFFPFFYRPYGEIIFRSDETR